MVIHFEFHHQDFVLFPLSSIIQPNLFLSKYSAAEQNLLFIFKLILQIRETSMLSWRQELTEASRAQGINMEPYNCCNNLQQ